jgi:hypothetical protein
MFNSWTHTKTYATEENLLKALAKIGLDNVPCTLVVQVPGTNRYTAVFGKSFLGNNFMYAAHQGFKVLG